MNTAKQNLESNDLYQKGLAAIRKKNFGYAIELLQQVLADYPQSIECRHNLWSAAREHNRSQQNQPGSVGKQALFLFLLKLRVWYLTKTRAYEKAIASQERLTLLNPDSISALLGLATLFKLTSNPAAVQAACEEVLLLDKNNFPALDILARLYFQTKHYDKAKTTADLILRIAPRNLDAENLLKDIAAVDSINQGFDNITPAT